MKANVVIAGNICVVDDPDSQGSSKDIDRIDMALVIQFDSKEAIREAMSSGKCEFTVFKRKEPFIN